MIGKAMIAVSGLVLVCLNQPVALALEAGVSSEGQAQAEVVSSLVVSREEDLAFGAVLAGESGTVSVTPAAVVTYRGGAQQACLPAACTTAHPARFSVVGEPGRSYRVDVPSSLMATGNATDGSGSAVPPLLVDGISIVTTSRPHENGVGQLDVLGLDDFRVGGVLHLPAGLPSADYRATVPIMVSYS